MDSSVFVIWGDMDVASVVEDQRGPFHRYIWRRGWATKEEEDDDDLPPRSTHPPTHPRIHTHAHL